MLEAWNPDTAIQEEKTLMDMKNGKYLLKLLHIVETRMKDNFENSAVWDVGQEILNIKIRVY